MFSTLEDSPHLQDYIGKHVSASHRPWGQCFTWPLTTTGKKALQCFSPAISYLRQLDVEQLYWSAVKTAQEHWAMKGHQSSASFWDHSLICCCKRKQMIPVGKLCCSNNKLYEIVFLLSSPSFQLAPSVSTKCFTSLSTLSVSPLKQLNWPILWKSCLLKLLKCHRFLLMHPFGHLV